MKPIRFLKSVLEANGRDHGGQLSAAFAYTAIFAIGPLLLIVVSLSGLIFGNQAAEGQLAERLNDNLGPNAAKALQSVVAHIQHSGTNVIVLMLGIIASLLAAGAIANQLQFVFHQVFGTKPNSRGFVKDFIYGKLKNTWLVILGGAVLVASLAITALISHVGHGVTAHAGFPPLVIELLNNIVSFLVFSGFLYFVFRVFPAASIPRKLAWQAAMIVGLLFLVGKIILAIVIGQNATASAYGAAASVIVLLLWFYYTAQILVLGAEGIKVYAENNGINLKPKSKTTTNLAEAFVRGFHKKS